MSSYETLVKTFLSEEDRDRFEWAIGLILCGYRWPMNVTLFGPPGSGKSTLLEIAEKIFDENCVEVITNHEGDFRPRFGKDEPFFVTINSYHKWPSAFESIGIRTTGERFPYDEYMRLVELAHSELEEIGDLCVSRYILLGEQAFNPS